MFLSNHITKISGVLSVFQQDWLKPRASCSNLKPSQRACSSTGLCWSPPLPSAAHSCLVQGVSDPISSHDQQMKIPVFGTLLHNLPLFSPAVFVHFSAFCAFLTQFLWLHFLAINFSHLHPVEAPFTITWLHESAVYTGVDQLYLGAPASARPVVHLANNQVSAFSAFSLPNSAALHSLSSLAATLTEGSKWGLAYVQHLINFKCLALKIHPIDHCSGFGEIAAGELCGDSCQAMQEVAIVLIVLYSHLQMKEQMCFYWFPRLVEDALKSHCSLVLKALTDKSQMEQALLEMERRLAAVSEEINLLFWILILNFSCFFKILTGY